MLSSKMKHVMLVRKRICAMEWAGGDGHPGRFYPRHFGSGGLDIREIVQSEHSHDSRAHGSHWKKVFQTRQRLGTRPLLATDRHGEARARSLPYPNPMYGVYVLMVLAKGPQARVTFPKARSKKKSMI